MKMMFELNKIYHGNTLELLPQLESDIIDLIICDGPYGVTNNEWDKIQDIQIYNLNLIKMFERVLKPGGSLYLFGKDNCIDFIDYRPYLTLNRKIIWYQPSRLAQGRLNYTNNYDLIVYFSKGKPKTFNLDDIRVSQMVNARHRSRCETTPSVLYGGFGKTKFNRNGKNPGDVWSDISQLTYKSKELIDRELLNTIQKPESLIERLVKASSNENDVVLDPFSGVGTTFSVCKRLRRNFIGFEMDKQFIEIAEKRVENVKKERKFRGLFNRLTSFQ